eukprot:scaffold6511_cov59-Phaeocystis_antarctica.AAC.1
MRVAPFGLKFRQLIVHMRKTLGWLGHEARPGCAMRPTPAGGRGGASAHREGEGRRLEHQSAR